MDRLLRQQLDALARDRQSGAAELARRAVTALQSWLRRHPKPTEQELLDIACALLRAQPLMAPLWRLGNEVALAIETRNPTFALKSKLAAFGLTLRSGPQRIARHFRRALPNRENNLLLTYSYSSTAVGALIHARSRIMSVYCSEGRPGYEGRRTASELTRAEIQVLFSTDAKLLSGHGYWRHVVVGADAVLPDAFWNKVGTEILVRNAREVRASVWVLADTTKFCPESTFGLGPHLAGSEEDQRQVWEEPPRGTLVFAGQYGFTFFSPRMRIVTEKGLMRPPDVRRELRNIPISPRLKALTN